MTNTRKTVFKLLDFYNTSLEDIASLVKEDFENIKQLRALINKDNHRVVFEDGDRRKYEVRLQSAMMQILWSSSHLTNIIDTFYCMQGNNIVVAYEQSEKWN